MKTLTTEEFIKKARAVHGDRYDYTLAEVIGNNKTKVTIKCNTCGIVFEQRINDHLNGKGCSNCGKKQRAKSREMTKEEFILKAKEKHKWKYEYNNVKWNGYNEMVTITCPIHGNFMQLPNSHLNGRGCPYCAGNKKSTTEEFIKKSKEVHGNKYKYDNVVYSGNNIPVFITCPIHGDFPMTPHNHKAGHGCPDCAKEKISGNPRMSTEEFVARAMASHGNKYDYSKSVYKGSDEKVIITCCKHGDFHQLPHAHFNGQGCPWCHSSHLEEQVRNFLNQNNIAFESQKKFSWLKNKKKMSLDFYLPDYNVAIECQGEQHYLTEEKGYYTTEMLCDIKQRDKLKHSLCQEHGIHIHYIKYDEDVNVTMFKLIKSIS